MNWEICCIPIAPEWRVFIKFELPEGWEPFTVTERLVWLRRQTEAKVSAEKE